MRVLITSGATIEYIDGIRYITNFSSGKTGAEIANYFASNTWEVYYLHGKNAILPKFMTTNTQFSSFSDLDNKLKTILNETQFDLIIHAAAISDFSIDHITIEGKKYLPENLSKIKSSEKSISIKLKNNYKILPKLKSYAKYSFKDFEYSEPIIVGFKFTNTNSINEKLDAITKLYNESNVNYIVHNDMNEIGYRDERTFYIYKGSECKQVCHGRDSLAKALFYIGNKTFNNVINISNGNHLGANT